VSVKVISDTILKSVKTIFLVVTDEQALKESTFAESSNYKGNSRGKGKEKWGRINGDGGRQNLKTDSDNDQSNCQG